MYADESEEAPFPYRLLVLMLLLYTIRFDKSQELVSLLELFSEQASNWTDPDSATEDWLESMPSQFVGGRKLRFSSSIVVFSMSIALETFATEIICSQYSSLILSK